MIMLLGLLGPGATGVWAAGRPPPRRARVPVTVPALLARAQPLRDRRLLPPPVQMEHVNTHARLLLRPDTRQGGFSAAQMRQLMNFLRCHHTQKRWPIDARLAHILYTAARHYQGAKIYVISGYRAPQVAREKGNPNSPHRRGVACDFRLEGVPLESLRDYLRRTFPYTGVGYYPNAGFVHVDVGRRHSAYWVDLSGPGERARYAATQPPPGPQRDPLPQLEEVPTDRSPHDG
ncbi:MAG: DUF882 domain-containing protein [Myxococcales bacterium]|nr:DUF882 domain-containing protein [Myxococcota bacterium]MDW8282221.1 DUF882 domain-containing protein [Myxococcales bacterium]